MKTRVLLAATLLVGVAVSAQASIVGTKHDLSSANPNATTNTIQSQTQDQTCAFCHAPHNAVTNKLLWNRNAVVGGGASMKIYTSYNTTQMRNAIGNTINALGDDSSSLLCLSCHSLTTADDIITNTANSKGGTLMTGYTGNYPAVTGSMSDLRSDHPVGIDYSLAQAQATATGLILQVNGTVTNAGTTLRLFKSLNGGDNSMECATCHDVHGNALGYGKFLAADPAGSKICTTCHVK